MGKRQRNSKNNMEKSNAAVCKIKRIDSEEKKADISKQPLYSMLISIAVETALTLLGVTVLPEEMKQIRFLVWGIYAFLVGTIVLYFLVTSKRPVKNGKSKKTICILYWSIAVAIIIILLFGTGIIRSRNREMDHEPIKITIEYKDAVEINNKQIGTTKTILKSDGSLSSQTSYETVKGVQYNDRYGRIATVSGEFKTIYSYTFDGEKNNAYSIIDHVILMDGVETIEKRAFYKCKNLQSIFMPQSIISIDDAAFVECDKLTLIVYENSYAHYYCKENNLEYEIANQ